MRILWRTEKIPFKKSITKVQNRAQRVHVLQLICFLTDLQPDRIRVPTTQKQKDHSPCLPKHMVVDGFDVVLFSYSIGSESSRKLVVCHATVCFFCPFLVSDWFDNSPEERIFHPKVLPAENTSCILSRYGICSETSRVINQRSCCIWSSGRAFYNLS